MKRNLLTAAAAATLTSAIISSCSGSGNAQNDTQIIDSTLHATETDIVSYNTVRSYALADSASTDSSYLSIAVDVQWPTKVGHYDISVLQDSILSLSFDADKEKGIQESMLRYVSDVSQAGFSQSGATPIQKVVNEGINSYSISTTGRIVNIGRRLLTYQIDQYSFLGGAHPNTVSKIFTYDLQTGKVVTIRDLIESEKLPLFTIGVKKQLADQTELTIAELNQDLLVKEFMVSNIVYIADGFIYVHYNPYDILPYSMGAIDVEMSPFEYSSLLTSYARELLLE